MTVGGGRGQSFSGVAHAGHVWREIGGGLWSCECCPAMVSDETVRTLVETGRYRLMDAPRISRWREGTP